MIEQTRQEMADDHHSAAMETVEQDAPVPQESKGSVPDAPASLPEHRRPPKANKFEQERKKKNLMKEAHSVAHLVSHHPFNPFCQACVEARAQRKGHKKGTFIDNHEPGNEWGKHVTGDHFVNTRSENVVGTYYAGDNEISCATTAAILLDVDTGEIQCYPRATRGTNDTISAFQSFSGGRPVHSFYCDNAPELAAAAVALGWMLDTSTPGVPQKKRAG
jgi:hypothetical protein